MDHWWPIRYLFEAEVFQSRQRNHPLVEKRPKFPPNLIVIISSIRRKLSRYGAVTIPPPSNALIEIKSRQARSINNPNRPCWENTRGPSLELVSMPSFYSTRNAMRAQFLIGQLWPGPFFPLLSSSLPLLLAPLNSFYRSRISSWIVGHCIKGFTASLSDTLSNLDEGLPGRRIYDRKYTR